jgi:hypothetical protein
MQIARVFYVEHFKIHRAVLPADKARPVLHLEEKRLVSRFGNPRGKPAVKPISTVSDGLTISATGRLILSPFQGSAFFWHPTQGCAASRLAAVELSEIISAAAVGHRPA